MRWLPTVATYDWVGGFDDRPDAAGYAILIAWGPWHVEICLGRRTGR